MAVNGAVKRLRDAIAIVCLRFSLRDYGQLKYMDRPVRTDGGLKVLLLLSVGPERMKRLRNLILLKDDAYRTRSAFIKLHSFNLFTFFIWCRSSPSDTPLTDTSTTRTSTSFRLLEVDASWIFERNCFQLLTTVTHVVVQSGHIL